jgi:cytochrome c-type biogenesis protein CcmH
MSRVSLSPALAARLLTLLAGLLLSVCALAQPTPTTAAADPTVGFTAEQQARYVRFTNELRCLVCQNQTIAESQAPLAVDLRERVGAQIAEGKTDAEIVDWLTARYGDFVLYRPPFKASTAMLWLSPFLLLGLALLIAWRVTRRRAPTALSEAAPDAAAVQRLLEEHHRR